MFIPESTQKYNLAGSDLSHSELAMKAAKGMRRSRQKTKTGHIVCRHLIEMLAEQPGHMIQRRFRDLRPSHTHQKAKHNAKQFMLAL